MKKVISAFLFIFSIVLSYFGTAKAQDTYTQEEVDALLYNAIQKYDPDMDGKIGLENVIYNLQIISGSRNIAESVPYQIHSPYIQFRRYVNGATKYRMWTTIMYAGQEPSSDIISELQVKKPDGQYLSFTSEIKYSSPNVYFYANYNPISNSWDEEFNGITESGYYADINSDSLSSGDYIFYANTIHGYTLTPYTDFFVGPYNNLPVIDSTSITDTWQNDGNLKIEWNIPTEMQTMNSDEWHTQVEIDAYNGGEYSGYSYFGRVPLLGTYIIVSESMCNKLKTYGNILQCVIRVRKNDNSQRSYSNSLVIWQNN